MPRGGGEKIRGGPIEHYSPRADKNEAIREIIRFLQIMSSEDNSVATLGFTTHRLPKIAPGGSIESCSGLVQNENIGVGKEREGESQSLYLPTRAFANLAVSEIAKTSTFNDLWNGEMVNVALGDKRQSIAHAKVFQ